MLIHRWNILERNFALSIDGILNIYIYIYISHARNVTHLVKSEFESELEKWSPPPLVSEEVESVLPIDICI